MRKEVNFISTKLNSFVYRDRELWNYFLSVRLLYTTIDVTFCVQVQVVPLLGEVPLQSWVHFILEVMAEAYEKIQCHGVEVSHFAYYVELCFHLAGSWSMD